MKCQESSSLATGQKRVPGVPGVPQLPAFFFWSSRYTKIGVSEGLSTGEVISCHFFTSSEFTSEFTFDTIQVQYRPPELPLFDLKMLRDGTMCIDLMGEARHGPSFRRQPLGDVIQNWLVVYLPLWKILVRQLGWWNSQYMENHNIHVPNHQPEKVISSGCFSWLDSILSVILKGRTMGVHQKYHQKFKKNTDLKHQSQPIFLSQEFLSQTLQHMGGNCCCHFGLFWLFEPRSSRGGSNLKLHPVWPSRRSTCFPLKDLWHSVGKCLVTTRKWQQMTMTWRFGHFGNMFSHLEKKHSTAGNHGEARCPAELFFIKDRSHIKLINFYKLCGDKWSILYTKPPLICP